MAGLAVALVTLTGGCGNQYRPVVSAINPVGPAGQPIKYAVAISNPSTYPNNVVTGLVTFVDVSGDTVLSTPSLGGTSATTPVVGGTGVSFLPPTTAGTATVAPSPVVVNPNDFVLSDSGSEAFVLNSQGAFTDFGVSNPTSLLTQNIVVTQLGGAPSGVQSFSLPSTGTTILVPQPNTVPQSISELEITSGPSLLQNLAVPNPVYVVGTDSAQRVYAISSNGAGNGIVYPIENTPVSIDTGNLITVGVNPVYGVMTADGNRAFILNKGSGTVSVINVPSNGPDAGMPTITLPPTVNGVTSAPNPVWADFVTVSSEMVVLNQGDGVHPGSLSIISIPLCNINTPVTNPNCNAANPVDAVGFGTIIATVPVGINPTMVSVLADGSRAYVVNSGVLPSGSNPGIEGSVSVVNLTTNQVITIPAISNPSVTQTASGTGSSPTMVYGHPNTVAATTGDPTGKVYVTSPDNQFLTIIETDIDAVDTHISLQGLGVRVLVNSK
jgi:hypothetical protein